MKYTMFLCMGVGLRPLKALLGARSLQPDVISLNAMLACKELDWPQALLWLATFDAWALEPDAPQS